jgi:hypothetical protein
MAILGLLNTESFSSQRFTNIRQKVFYFYPNGAAPLIGLLSILKTEESNDQKFSWYEKRLAEQRGTTAANTTGAYITTAGSPGSDAANPFTVAADGFLRVIVADSSIFRVGHQIQIRSAPVTGSTADIFGVITARGTLGGKQYIDLRLTEAATAVVNGATSVGIEVFVIGSSFAEGAGDTSSTVYNLPIQPENYLQIFRSPFSFTGSSLQTSLKFDDSGPYKDKAKETSVYHMIEMEKAFLFSRKQLYVTSNGNPQYQTGGIIYWLQTYEAGTVYGNTAATLDTDDNKRIITNSNGQMTRSLFNKYMERLFRVTNNMSNEKLCLCGTGFVAVMHDMFAGNTMFTFQQGSKMTFGMDCVKMITAFGTIYFKTHPIFNQHPILRYNGLFLDVPNLKYRYLINRDTKLLANRQNNDEDLRKDEWLSECGLEQQFPESHMYMQNVRQYVAG